MEKHFLSSKQSTVQFQPNNSGCVWGIFHFLDHHHWHNVKKVFPLKKHFWGRHATYGRKTIFYNHDISEYQQFEAAEAEPLLVRQQSENDTATGKRSPRRCKKEPHTENRLVKEEKSKGWILGFLPDTKHLESSEKSVQCKASGIINAVDYSRQNQAASDYALFAEKNGKTTEAALNQKLGDSSMHNGDISYKVNDHIDVLEVFRVEKDLLVKILHDLDIRKSFNQPSNNKAKLTKSGSFPLAKSSQMRNIGSSSLNHKKNEVWAFPNGEKSLAGTQTQKMFASSFAKFASHNAKQMPLVTDHDVDSGINEKPGVSSSGSSHGFNHKGWNQLVLHHFKVIKQKIKHTLVDFTKNGYLTSVEAIQHKASSEYRLSSNENLMSQSSEDGLIEEYNESRNSYETKASNNDSHRHEAGQMRRTPSLNESLDRYTQLFEQSFRDIKWHHSMSKSLKLTNEDKSEISGHAPKSSRRNLSLPNLDPLGFLLHEAIRDSSDIRIPVRTSVENNTDAEIDILVQRNSSKSEIHEVVDSSDGDLNPSTVEKYEREVTSDNREDIHKPAMGDGKDELVVLETGCENYATRHTEGTETDTRSSGTEELNTNVSAIAKGANKSGDNHFLLFELDMESDFNFKYVKDVIEFSGFLEEDEPIETWHTDTVDQVLKPSLFKELEGCLHKEMECSGEAISQFYDHQLLFNLVKEVLLEIYERSSTYFPRPFSFNHRLDSMPKGHHLLKQVWTRVDLYLRLKPELDQTLDDVVSRDLAHNGWKNLQWEEEFVALELEDMIVEDLLQEAIFS